jgi:hypothetical protein
MGLKEQSDKGVCAWLHYVALCPELLECEAGWAAGVARI